MRETRFCINGAGEELMAKVTGTTIGPSPPAEYTGCHGHDEEVYAKQTRQSPDLASD